eukprot:15985109-Heterocapsa_arctica.AAC.1
MRTAQHPQPGKGGRRGPGKPASGHPQGVQESHKVAPKSDHRPQRADHQGREIHPPDNRYKDQEDEDDEEPLEEQTGAWATNMSKGEEQE